MIPRKIKVVILADRGFGRTALATFCQEQGFGYVIRIQPSVTVRLQILHVLLVLERGNFVRQCLDPRRKLAEDFVQSHIRQFPIHGGVSCKSLEQATGDTILLLRALRDCATPGVVLKNPQRSLLVLEHHSEGSCGKQVVGAVVFAAWCLFPSFFFGMNRSSLRYWPESKFTA
jgi:hypothetical protein